MSQVASVPPTVNAVSEHLPERTPEPGELVQVRSRRWLVEETIDAPNPGESARVALACADDDNQGQTLTVFWDYEPDRRILQDEGWDRLAAKGFDATRQFAAFYNTLRWHCTTATDPNLFQAPFRAGIKIDAYQMEPLRKALRLPRVNLFIADDTGLGKTIEAGLIARELIQRRKAKTIVVAAPPSVLEQWKTELEDRFGLIFEILDRAYVSRMRRERGFGVNPWRTHSRFLVSHKLLIDESYTAPMREWLGDLAPASLLILDEAHHAAPASGGRYGIETKFTKAVRELSHRFEHRLFLSATPHNGHSNSFSTLLELLDPYRFTRGVKVRNAALDQVMVRRLKEDIRERRGGFPKRTVEPVVIDDLPEDAPELRLSGLLDEYRTEREKRHATASNRARAAAALLVVGLQQRLLSSIEAFARSLRVHRETVTRHWEQGLAKAGKGASVSEAFAQAADADDERAELSDDELDAEDSEQVQALTTAAEAQAERDAVHWQREQQLLDQMQEIAESTRHLPDAKTRYLIDWIRDNLCPELQPFGQPPSSNAAQWTNRRVLIFTENRQGTKRYLRSILEQAIEGTDRADERVAVIDGNTTGPRRKDIQRRFNRDPAEDPLRILLATDAAREGLNFQAHCTDLFHFDLPWNPGRIEQRNGRIDRKLQPAPEVHCRYFVLPQRKEDRVLEVLVRKTDTIKRELGSLAKVIEGDIEKQLRGGIRHSDVENLRGRIESLDLNADRKHTAEEELEASRDRRDALEGQIERCRSLLEQSRIWTGFDAEPFRDALSCSLNLLGVPPLQEGTDDNGNSVWELPRLEQRGTTDPSWTSTLDSLRAPRRLDQSIAEWRRDAPIRPVVFRDAGVVTEDTVHLHLEQRLAQRLLARFRAQGFVHHDLSRACLAQTQDSVPRVILLGRLSLYGQGAERLHEAIVPVAARWTEPSRRGEPLRRYARDAEGLSLSLLEKSLGSRAPAPNEVIQRRLLSAAPQDVMELRPQLQEVGEAFAEDATKLLAQRGNAEAEELRATLERQRDHVRNELADRQAQPQFGFDQQETAQLDADMRHWQTRLDAFDRDLEDEPSRIRAFYKVRAKRIEPIGIVYLWPESN
ncbi:MAG: DEAD/DEAH box helicase [Gammaproteobacteria bacterium]|nr:DEAD/DEAH box helicase [Gammaproteobacteria bacterium]